MAHTARLRQNIEMGSNTYKFSPRFIIVIIFASVCLGLMVQPFLNWLEGASRNIYQTQGVLEFLNAVAWATFLGSLILIFPVKWQIKRVLLILWTFRCFVTLFAMLYYESAYKLDAYLYYQDIIENKHFPDLVLGNGTNFMIVIGKVLSSIFPLGDSYHTLKVIWSFFGFIGIYQFYRIYVLYYNRDSLELLWALGLFPSIIFWTSILGKDPIAMFGIGITAYSILSLHKKANLQDFLFFVLGVSTLLLTRFWLAAIFVIPAVVSYTLTQTHSKIYRYSGVVILGIVSFYFLKFAQDTVNIVQASDVLTNLNRISSSWSHGGSALEAPELTSISAVVKFLPLGFFTAIFRPLPGDVMNVFGVMAGIESLLIIFITYRFMTNLKSNHIKFAPIVYCVFCILVWGCLYAFISYQNLGTAARFKAQILPFFVLIYFMVTTEIKRQRSKVRESVGIQPVLS